jgi:hypothetical protein
MGIENLLAQGVQIRPAGMERNALMQAQEFKDRQQRNALMQMQMQDVSQQRQLAIQQAQREAAQKQELDGEMARIQGGGQLDPVRLLQLKVPQAQIEFLANRGNLGRQEVAREGERAGANGRPEKVFFDKFGSPVGQAMPQAVKMEMADQGGSRVAYDPYGLLAGQQFKKTQTPDSIASNAVTMRGQNMVDARSRQANETSLSKPFEVTGLNGPMLVQQTKDGKIVPVDGYAPKTAPDKPLAPSVVKNITEARDNALTIAGLSSSFKPEFAGKGVLGLGADMQMSVSGNVGADADAVEWWKNYRKQAELIERHALFGAALTPTEQASWRSADIGPGMDAKVVARNLATREKFTKQVLEAARQDSIDAGHSETRVNAIAGRKPTDAGGQKPSGAVQTATNPKTGEKLQLVNGQWVPAK